MQKFQSQFILVQFYNKYVSNDKTEVSKAPVRDSEKFMEEINNIRFVSVLLKVLLFLRVFSPPK